MNATDSIMRIVVAVTTTAIMVGCAGEMAYREGKALMIEGKTEDGLVKLEQATREAPDNLEFRIAYLNARDSAVTGRLAKVQQAKRVGALDEASGVLGQVLKIDPTNVQGIALKTDIEDAHRHLRLIEEASIQLRNNDFDGADQKIAKVLSENPQHAGARVLKRQLDDKGGRNQVLPPSLRAIFRKPINLELRDTNLKQLIEVLSRHSGINFVLDKDISPSLTTTIFLREISVEDVLDVILTTHRLEKRVLNETTVLIFPNTAEKLQEHQELVVKSFYLANANAKQVMEMLKTVIKARNLYVDEKLNMLIMRDTPSAVKLAERLVALQDVAEPEVMLEVEVMEVQRTRLQQLGIQFPDQLTLIPLPSSGSTVTLNDLRNLNSSLVGASLSNTIINLHKDIGNSNILANPRIRTRNREKAEIKIGDRVPVITTTSTATGFVAESVQYVDVGLKLNAEPTIYPDNEVNIRISLEVSSVVKEVISKAGSLTYQIGSRNASTVLRLRDGETQILGGLINDQDRVTANRVPGLGDLPIIGRLFSSQKDDTQKTELVLSITPHLVRGIGPPPQVPTEFWSGTEARLRMKPLALSVETEATRIALPTHGNISAGNMMPVGDATNQSPIAAKTAKPPMLRWEGSPQGKVGGVFDLAVSASIPTALSKFPLQIKYDPAVMELVDASTGLLMSGGDGKVDLSRKFVAGSGIAFLTLTRTGNAIQGDGELVHLKFKALKLTDSSVVSILPAIAVGPDSKPLPQSGPTMVGVRIFP